MHICMGFDYLFDKNIPYCILIISYTIFCSIYQREVSFYLKSSPASFIDHFPRPSCYYECGHRCDVVYYLEQLYQGTMIHSTNNKCKEWQNIQVCIANSSMYISNKMLIPTLLSH